MSTLRSVSRWLIIWVLMASSCSKVDRTGEGRRQLNSAAGKAYEQEQYAEAEKLYQDAIDDAESSGAEDWIFYRSLNGFGNVYRLTDRFAEAERLYHRSFSLREKALGPNHPEVASSLDSLALIYALQGRDSESDAAFERSQAIKRNNREAFSLSLATELTNEGDQCVDGGKYNEAASCYTRARIVYEKALGPDDLTVAQAYDKLAKSKTAQHREAEATYYAKRAAQIRSRAEGK